ncbi:MAG: DUF4258 domain-containing protein [Phycisphaerales bacterium]
MNADTRKAVSTIRRCVAADRVMLTRHFRVRLAERGVLWADVRAVVDAPASARVDGMDDAGRSRWIVEGRAADGVSMGLVCVIGRDDAGDLAVFVTAFWED